MESEKGRTGERSPGVADAVASPTAIIPHFLLGVKPLPLGKLDTPFPSLPCSESRGMAPSFGQWELRGVSWETSRKGFPP